MYVLIGMEEKTLACKLSIDELTYLNDYWDGKFSSYVHNSIKRDKKQVNTNRARSFFEKTVFSVICLGMGVILALFSSYINNFFMAILTLLLGSFFTIYALLGIYIEVFKQWKKTS